MKTALTLLRSYARDSKGRFSWIKNKKLAGRLKAALAVGAVAAAGAAIGVHAAGAPDGFQVHDGPLPPGIKAARIRKKLALPGRRIPPPLPKK